MKTFIISILERTDDVFYYRVTAKNYSDAIMYLRKKLNVIRIHILEYREIKGFDGGVEGTVIREY